MLVFITGVLGVESESLLKDMIEAMACSFKIGNEVSDRCGEVKTITESA